jgi:lipopolysaccharide/colanic/teichoic acid biosynthesis glycosyltransferase
MKRTIDMVFSASALVVLSPLLLLVAIILRGTGEGCIFYRQERVGRGGRIFPLYKFVTMRKDSGHTPGDLLTAKNDPRVLPFGRILRATKINELPQLFNVLLGDMTLIGPRPQVRPHFDMYPEHVKREIVKVRPGLSGIGSIIFHEESSLLAKCGKDHNRCYREDIAPYKGKLEVWYVQHQSVLLDLALIFLTVLVVLSHRSGYYVQWLKGLPQPDSAVLSASLASV